MDVVGFELASFFLALGLGLPRIVFRAATSLLCRLVPAQFYCASISAAAMPPCAEVPPASACPPLDGKLIRWDQITRAERLGQGGYGTVHLGLYQGQKVVCKTFPTGLKSAARIRRTYRRELRALELDISHPNIVTTLGATSLQGWEAGACIVMSFGGCTDLWQYVMRPGAEWSLRHALFHSLQIMEGLNYLHSRNILHLDLKPDNCVFCPEEAIVRLCDFGGIHVMGEAWNPQSIPGTSAFRDPELFHTASPNASSDIFSLGVTMYCLDYRRHPYANMAPEMIKLFARHGSLRPEVHFRERGPLTDRFRSVYSACWAADPADRPTLSQVIATVRSILSDLDG